MKFAWMVVSGPQFLVREAVNRLEVIADTYLSPSTPVQLAAPKFLAWRKEMQAQLQNRIAANLAYLDGSLDASSSLMRLVREGGWYAVLRVPTTMIDEDLGVALIERCSVLAHPGHFFDFPADGFLVLSLIASEADFHEGVRHLGSLFSRKSF